MPDRSRSWAGSRQRFLCLLALALNIFVSGYPATLSSQPVTPVLVGAGDIARCGDREAEATAKLLDGIAGTVFTVGDNAYPKGRERLITAGVTIRRGAGTVIVLGRRRETMITKLLKLRLTTITSAILRGPPDAVTTVTT